MPAKVTSKILLIVQSVSSKLQILSYVYLSTSSANGRYALNSSFLKLPSVSFSKEKHWLSQILRTPPPLFPYLLNYLIPWSGTWEKFTCYSFSSVSGRPLTLTQMKNATTHRKSQHTLTHISNGKHITHWISFDYNCRPLWVNEKYRM